MQEHDMSDKLTDEEVSKDKYFSRISRLSEEMIADHGKDFAMGALVLAAQWIVDGNKRASESSTSH